MARSVKFEVLHDRLLLVLACWMSARPDASAEARHHRDGGPNIDGSYSDRRIIVWWRAPADRCLPLRHFRPSGAAVASGTDQEWLSACYRCRTALMLSPVQSEDDGNTALLDVPVLQRGAFITEGMTATLARQWKVSKIRHSGVRWG